MVVVTTPAVRPRNGAPAVLQVGLKQVASFVPPENMGTMLLAMFSGIEKPKAKTCVPVKSAGGVSATKTRSVLSGAPKDDPRNI